MNYAKSDLELMVGKDEKVLWRGKPNKRCFILEGIFNPLLPFAFIWGLIDFTIIGVTLFAKESSPLLLGFLLIHLMPVWIYLGGVVFVFRRYQHTEYIVTDKGVYTSGGLFSYTCNMKPFSELARVNIHRGIIDQLIGVGDVVLTSNNIADFYSSNVRVNGRPLEVGMTIADIKDYRKVFELIKKLQEDIYTDTMYPNALRPEENLGFRTKYKGLD
ncbi:MAG: PH domain-containing protein [Candidatus Gastranaerophilales bacterium]|nr:PH domain-containing protein [Candidatus Gastranaerophilales bacterium]MCM1072513.1 PH domain-containing protein [Bacteroides sp.]